MKTRFSLLLVAALVGISVGAWGQNQKNTDTLKVKPTKEKPSKTVPAGKSATKTTSSTNAKSLQSAERGSAKVHNGSGGGAGKKKAPGLKQVKDKPNPPMHFNGSGAGKSRGTTKGGSNPYKSRLKAKGVHH